VGIGPGAQAALASKDVTFTRTFFTAGKGAQIFYQLIEPLGRAPSHVLVFFHGYASHGDQVCEILAEYARKGALVVVPDLPNHGRSDGLLLYVPSWWAWVNRIWEFLDSVVEPLRVQDGSPRKVFGMGMSLGGGLATCLGTQRPTFFDGLILVAPMLFVSDDVKPPVVVQQAFKKVLGPFRLSWPMTPSKPFNGGDFRVAEQGDKFNDLSPFTMRTLRPRLATAKEFTFTFPEWMAKHMSELRTPFVVLHSRADKITDSNMSERLYQEACAEDKSLRLYDDAFHCEMMSCTEGNAELIGMSWEPEQIAATQQCTKDILSWIAARVPVAPPACKIVCDTPVEVEGRMYIVQV
jgi:acylglycerol lipase